MKRVLDYCQRCQYEHTGHEGWNDRKFKRKKLAFAEINPDPHRRTQHNKVPLSTSVRLNVLSFCHAYPYVIALI